MPEVFLSYARADGESRAAYLRDRLIGEAPDVVIQQDRLLLEGGVGWWKQITEAIDSVEFLILVMTPGAITSGNVEKEWRYARQQGVCVYPVKGAHLETGLALRVLEGHSSLVSGVAVTPDGSAPFPRLETTA